LKLLFQFIAVFFAVITVMLFLLAGYAFVFGWRALLNLMEGGAAWWAHAL
jgi:hypothetical protein